MLCEEAARPSSVVGGGPHGTLYGANVYAHVLGGFCPDILVITVTRDDRLVTPLHPASAVIRMMIPDGTMPWSGAYPVTIESPDEGSPSTGTLEVEHATAIDANPSRIRATARFTGAWDLTVGLETTYCTVSNCF